MKIPFDYTIICEPAVKPTKLVFHRGWLACKSTEWQVGYWGAPCPGGDWILAIARIFPFILIFIMDTSLFYQVTITLYGICLGMFKLDLGVLTGWDEVVQEFYKAPARWWHKCMSPLGNDNQIALLKQTMFLVDETNQGNGINNYASAVVSDGLMFKKAVLTPEEIAMGMSRPRGINDGGGKLAGGPSSSNILQGMWETSKAQMASTGLDAGGGKTALLSSATNTTTQRRGLKSEASSKTLGAAPPPAPAGLGTREEREAAIAKRISRIDPSMALKADAEASAQNLHQSVKHRGKGGKAGCGE